MFVDKEFVELW